MSMTIDPSARAEVAGGDPELVRVAVLTRYGPLALAPRWTALGAGGGFSGARVWRGDDPSGAPVLVLKAWHPGMTAERLGVVHHHAIRAGHLSFVPRVYPTADGQTVVVADGR